MSAAERLVWQRNGRFPPAPSDKKMAPPTRELIKTRFLTHIAGDLLKPFPFLFLFLFFSFIFSLLKFIYYFFLPFLFFLLRCDEGWNLGWRLKQFVAGSHFWLTDRQFALGGHVTSFLWKWKLYDFAFEERLVGHIRSSWSYLSN